MPRMKLLACLLIGLLTGNAAYAQTAEQAQQLITGLGLPSNPKITFVDGSGKAVDYDEFMRQVNQPGHSFSAEKDFNAHTATLRIKVASTPPAASSTTLKIKAGDALPAFSLHDAHGHRLTNAALTGHYTLLSFYFADCPPCIAEVPTLNALAKQPKDFKVLAATYETQDVALAFAKQHRLEVPSLTGAQQWIDTIGISTYPTLLLIDPQGRLVAEVLSTALVTPQDKDHVPSAAEITRWVEKHRAVAKE